ncbi:MAG: porin, partial [Proteobacteria bacterium]|nr:porin [Pseudomonadota bacterium]
MRKLLLSTTALASAAVLTANIAVADVSISATTEWKYVSTGSEVTTQDGTKFDNDSEIIFNFSNKTDSGLTIGYTVELDTDASTATPVDESSFSISGGFGKIVLGQNDGVGD